MNIFHMVNCCRSVLVAIVLFSVFVLTGCSQTKNEAPSTEEQLSFSGDRSKMPEAEKQRIQQMQQETQQRMQEVPKGIPQTAPKKP